MVKLEKRIVLLALAVCMMMGIVACYDGGEIPAPSIEVSKTSLELEKDGDNAYVIVKVSDYDSLDASVKVVKDYNGEATLDTSRKDAIVTVTPGAKAGTGEVIITAGNKGSWSSVSIPVTVKK
ncbi:MAG: hypothetical protein K2O09_06950 [Treponemataceae bacterium]|nr:hypothetical protein [Treponemataceae bacterium]